MEGKQKEAVAEGGGGQKAKTGSKGRKAVGEGRKAFNTTEWKYNGWKIIECNLTGEIRRMER